jgi:hypothetical protein
MSIHIKYSPSEELSYRYDHTRLHFETIWVVHDEEFVLTFFDVFGGYRCYSSITEEPSFDAFSGVIG